jgi:hypothetical protein
MVQTAKHRFPSHHVTGWYSVAFYIFRSGWPQQRRNAAAQTHVNPLLVVMRDPGDQNPSEMSLGQWDQEI